MTLATTTHAAIVGLQIDGVVESIVEGNIPNFAAQSGIEIGDPASLTFYYDDSVLDTSTSINTSEFNDAIINVSGGTGAFDIDYSIPPSLSQIGYQSNVNTNDYPGDHVYYLAVVESNESNGLTIDYTTFLANDTSSNSWAHGEQQTVLSPNPLFNGFGTDSTEWVFLFSDASGNQALVYMDALQITEVPEPATLVLVAMSGLMIVRRRRRA